MTTDPIAALIDAELLSSDFAQTVAYSRPGNQSLEAVTAFSIQAIVDTSGEYATPAGSIFASALVQTSAIPLGPQKGDLIVCVGNTIPDGTYRVQEFDWDRSAGSAKLKIRSLSQ